jgi:phosphatidylglycerol:prolipoprotein diacylglycerol transferase
MIPWFELHTITIGPITIQVWGTLVALGFLMATWVAARRAKKQGIDPIHLWNMAPWILIAAFVVARLFHVFFYDPAWFMSHPSDIINPSIPGYSMMGGVIGGVVAGLIYIWRKKLQLWVMADLVAYALPLGTAIGRIGCFLIHDHPGKLTHFILGVKYPDGVRHDHGLYLSLLGWGMFILFYILGRKKRPPGYFVGLWLVIDGAVRFFLDFYRIGDKRYAGLTPTQWLLILTVAVGVVLLTRVYKKYGPSR